MLLILNIIILLKINFKSNLCLGLQKCVCFWPRLRIKLVDAHMNPSCCAPELTKERKAAVDETYPAEKQDALECCATLAENIPDGGLIEVLPMAIDDCIQVVKNQGCCTELMWIERHVATKYFKEMSNFEPSFNGI